MSSPIRLVKNEDATATEVGTDAVWVATGYTEPRENLDVCVVCDGDIEEWELWLCLDGGDCAHTGCVEMEEAS